MHFLSLVIYRLCINWNIGSASLTDTTLTVAETRQRFFPFLLPKSPEEWASSAPRSCPESQDFSLLLFLYFLGCCSHLQGKSWFITSVSSTQPVEKRKWGRAAMEGKQLPFKGAVQVYHYHSHPMGQNLVTWAGEAGKYYLYLAGHELSPNSESPLIQEEGEKAISVTVSKLCHTCLFLEAVWGCW